MISNKRSLSAAEILLLALTVLFLTSGISVFAWYGLTYIPVRQTSDIRPREVTIRQGNVQCILDIPAGNLSIRRPPRAAVGSGYRFEAEIQLDQPLRFTNCTGRIPNWSINLEAQTALVSSDVKPFAAIRQPAFDRDHFRFQWTFTPEETVPQYQSHLWLRAIITQQDQVVENWNILVRDFPMENSALFGQPTVIWLIGGGFSLLFGMLLLILSLQKRRMGSRKAD